MNPKSILALIASLFLFLSASGCTFSVENNVNSGAYEVEEVTSDEFYGALSKTGISQGDPIDSTLRMTEDSAFAYEGNVFLLLHGSSSCPPVPLVSDTSVDDADADLLTTVSLGYESYGDVACTDDYGQHFYLLQFEELEVSDGASIMIDETRALPLPSPAA